MYPSDLESLLDAVEAYGWVTDRETQRIFCSDECCEEMIGMHDNQEVSDELPEV